MAAEVVVVPEWVAAVADFPEEERELVAVLRRGHPEVSPAVARDHRLEVLPRSIVPAVEHPARQLLPHGPAVVLEADHVPQSSRELARVLVLAQGLVPGHDHRRCLRPGQAVERASEAGPVSVRVRQLCLRLAQELGPVSLADPLPLFRGSEPEQQDRGCRMRALEFRIAWPIVLRPWMKDAAA